MFKYDYVVEFMGQVEANSESEAEDKAAEDACKEINKYKPAVWLSYKQ